MGLFKYMVKKLKLYSLFCPRFACAKECEYGVPFDFFNNVVKLDFICAISGFSSFGFTF